MIGPCTDRAWCDAHCQSCTWPEDEALQSLPNWRLFPVARTLMEPGHIRPSGVSDREFRRTAPMKDGKRVWLEIIDGEGEPVDELTVVQEVARRLAIFHSIH